MNCYLCEIDSQTNGLNRYGICPAVGVCGHCHVGVCLDHSIRDHEQGLTCLQCAKELGIAKPLPAPTADSKHTGFWERLTLPRKTTI